MTFSASERLRQSQLKYKALATMIRSQVRRARNHMITARSMASYYKAAVLPLRQRIVDQTLLEYNSMLIGAFQLLESKGAQIEAGQKYVESLTEYWLSRTELEEAVGGQLVAGEPNTQRAETASTSMPQMNHANHGE